MAYNPQVSDDRAKYIMMGGQAVSDAIGNFAGMAAQGISQYKDRRETEDMMAGRLDAMGLLADPDFATKFADAPFGKKKGLYADALLQYERQISRDEDAWKMNQRKDFAQWSANLDEKVRELDPAEQAELPGMVELYLSGATNGLAPSPNFLQRVMSMSGKGRDAFMQLVGKGMDLFDMANRKQAQPPQFMPAPGGGRVMVNPNTGASQYIPDPQAPAAPTYATIPTPPAGQTGILNDGKGGMKVIPGGTPSSAPGPASIFGDATGQDGLPEDSPEEADARLRSMNALFGE